MPEAPNPVIESQGKATASMILGILSIVLALAWFISIFLAIVAIVLGVLSLKGQGRGKALAGIITGSIGILLGFVLIGVVFLAVPSLQRNSRDTSRKSDIARLSSNIVEFQANNSGTLPSAGELPQSFTIVTSVTDGGIPTIDNASYVAGENCDGVASSRTHSVTIMLENGKEYCVGS